MKREELIKKWLDNELSTQELDAFKELEDYDTLVKLSNNMAHFNASDYDSNIELNKVLTHIKAKKQNNWLKPFLRVAAVLVITFGFYYYTTTLDTTLKTLASHKTTIELPDASSIVLNAVSSISYNEKNWDDNREIKLHGEAFFKVAKGSKFKVITEAGIVTVLGTQFNIKQRDNYFEVICYEGSVSVKDNSNSVILKPGNSFLIIDGTLISKDPITVASPSWIHNESHFKSIPFKEVITEFERQYNVSINSSDVNTTQLFTGSFSHNNMTIALKAITVPLHLTYSKTNTTIILKRE